MEDNTKFYSLIGFKELNSYAKFYKEVTSEEMAIKLFNRLCGEGKYQRVVLREDCNGVSKVIRVNTAI